MKRFITFGSIDQFRQTIRDVKFNAQYLGYSAELERTNLDKDAEMPVITAIGSEKIHGSNAAICYSHSDGFWVQSRKNIITPEKDNAGCAFAAYANEEAWLNIIHSLADEYDIDLDKNIISVYYEWAGGNIQKKSALTGKEKLAMIFRYFKVSHIEPQLNNNSDEVGAIWLETKVSDDVFPSEDYSNSSIFEDRWVSNHDAGIYNIMNYPTVAVIIDFNEPLMSQNKMIELVENLEKSSAVGEAFGISGNVGEGYVFTFEYKGQVYRFKVKGELHAKGAGKVKTLSPVDEEKENLKRAFVNDIACVSWRLEQMYNETMAEVNVMDMTHVQVYLRKIFNDVIKEESDLMSEMGIEPKTINGMISKVAVTYFRSRLNEEL